MDIEMENSVLSFQPFDIGGMQMKYDSSKGFQGGKGGNRQKQTHFYGTEGQEESGNISSLSSDLGYYQENAAEEGLWLSEYQQHVQTQSPISNYGSLDDFHFQTPVSPLIQPGLVEVTKSNEILTGRPDDHLVKPTKEKQYPFRLASLELLNNYGSGLKRLNVDKTTEQSCYDTTCKKVGHQEYLSTEEIMKVAGEIFIHSYSKRMDSLSIVSHPFGFYFSGLSNEEIRNLQLAKLLLAAAEKVGYQQFDRASRLLHHCDTLSSKTGNLVQRVVYYFSEALRERIDRQTGRITSEDLGMKQSFDLDEAMGSESPTNLACHRGIPFYQVAQFTGIQAIVENVAGAKKVHIIDFAIRHGMQWTVLIQALAVRDECPLELLKITAVGTTSKQKVEDTGKRLLNFAQSMNLPFSFKIVMVSDMLDLKEDLFESEAEEAIAVYCPFLLRTMIVQPNRLEPLMSVIRNINPCIVVVIEVEANHNSTAFVNRFIEALFFFSAYFDCLETCMDPEDPNKEIAESIYFGNVIRNIVATEGEERTIRHVKIDVWRAFFKRYGMVETELSMSSLYQASLVVKEFASGSSCTLDMDEKSLIIGWKGTPMHSLSAWKFLS